MGLPTDCAAVLLMETDGHPAAVADEAERMAAIARVKGAREVRLAKDEAEALALAAARRNAFSALKLFHTLADCSNCLCPLQTFEH